MSSKWVKNRIKLKNVSQRETPKPLQATVFAQI